MQTHEFAPGLYLDIETPTGAPAPVIVWVHGGGWRLQDRTARPDFTRYFPGFAMVSIDYRLAPAHPHPAQVDDLLAALDFLRTQDLGIDATRIGLWGSSAGSHVALLAAARDGSVRCVVDGYGPTDIPALLPEEPGPRSTPEQDLLGGPEHVTEAAAQAASPMFADLSSLPPTLIMHGTADAMIPSTQSAALHARLCDLGRDSTLLLIDSLGHGFFNPGDVQELGPGITLDNGRLEREPDHSFSTSQSENASFSLHGQRADFALVESFFHHHLT